MNRIHFSSGARSGAAGVGRELAPVPRTEPARGIPPKPICRCTGARRRTWSGRRPSRARGWSSPIVWGNRVFLTTTLEARHEVSRALCRHRSGKNPVGTSRSFEQVPLRKEGKNSYATPTPCTDGETRLRGIRRRGVAALTLDGSVVWTNREVQFYSRHGTGRVPHRPRRAA
jgi:hypothetical protein